MIRTLIVDDEDSARRRVRDLLRDVIDFKVVDECADGAEALASAKRHAPDLVFLDVSLGGIDGIETARLLRAQGSPHLIFVTGHGGHASEAFDLEAVDYLTKPLSGGRFGSALDRVRARLQPRLDVANPAAIDRAFERLTRLSERAGQGGRLAIKDGTKYRLLDTSMIMFIRSDGDYLHVHVAGQAPFMVRGRLSSIEERIASPKFLRISRSALINMDYVAELKPRKRGDYEFVIKTGERLPSGATYRGSVRKLLAAVKCW